MGCQAGSPSTPPSMGGHHATPHQSRHEHYGASGQGHTAGIWGTPLDALFAMDALPRTASVPWAILGAEPHSCIPTRLVRDDAKPRSAGRRRAPHPQHASICATWFRRRRPAHGCAAAPCLRMALRAVAACFTHHLWARQPAQSHYAAGPCHYGRHVCPGQGPGRPCGVTVFARSAKRIHNRLARPRRHGQAGVSNTAAARHTLSPASCQCMWDRP